MSQPPASPGETPLRTWRRRLAPWGRASLDLLFPPQCVLCAKGLEEQSTSADERTTPFCRECLAGIFSRRVRWCRRCGSEADDQRSDAEPAEHCLECRHRRFHFAGVRPLGKYEGPLREAILRLKRRGCEPLARALTDLLWREAESELRAFAPDVVAPIPMHWRRRLRRGVNGPDYAAERLADLLGAPLAVPLLVRRRLTNLQIDLTARQRSLNLRDAFRLGRGFSLREARVLLVDDILTTGATCHAAAGVLREAGAAAVQVAVFGRAEGPPR